MDCEVDGCTEKATVIFQRVWMMFDAEKTDFPQLKNLDVEPTENHYFCKRHVNEWL